MFTTTPDNGIDWQLALALRQAYGGPTTVPVYDDGIGSLYVYGDEYGPTLVIRADSWDSAYEIAMDESDPIPVEELPEAYGFDTEQEMRDAEKRGLETGQYPELEEGYQYQANATGTGIVNTGHYEWLESVDTYNRGQNYFPEGRPILPVFVPW